MSKAVDGTDVIYCRMAMKRVGVLGVSVRKVRTLTEDGDRDTDW